MSYNLLNKLYINLSLDLHLIQNIYIFQVQFSPIIIQQYCWEVYKPFLFLNLWHLLKYVASTANY